MRCAAIFLVILASNLSNGHLLAQTGDDWKWLLSIQMINPNTGWAIATEGYGGVFAKGAIGSVVRTTDGGRHWKDVTPDAPPRQRFPQGVGAVHALTHVNAWVTAELVPETWDGHQPGTPVTFHTVNGGKTWRRITIPVDGWLMDFINARDGWRVSGKLLRDPNNVRWHPLFDIRRTTDGGERWNTIGSVKLPTHPSQIVFLNSTTGWITGGTPDRVYLFVTRDGGHTWRESRLPTPPQLTSARRNLGSPQLLTAQNGILPVPFKNDKGEGVFFYITHDGGTTWRYTTPLSLPSSASHRGDVILGYWGSSFADVEHGWVTDGETLNVTTDGGRRWAKIKPKMPFDRPLVDLEFITPLVGWATGPQLNEPFLLKTLDGGRTWTSVPYVIVRR